MPLIKRLSYYLIGVVIGAIFVYFIFGNRDFQCSYFPNARVLKDLKSKELIFSDVAACQKACLRLDTLAINQLFAAGAINFSNSDARKEPCGEYEILTRLPDMREITARVQNCDSTVTLLQLQHAETTCDCR